MNYVLVNIGQNPQYVKFTINSILSVDKDSEIYYLTDTKTQFKHIKVLNLNEYENEIIQNLKMMELYKNSNYESNPLWINSLLRVFYLNSFFQRSSIDQLVHIDNDVLIYKPFKEIESCFDINKLNITQLSISQLIFSYSYFSNKKILQSIEDFIFNHIKKNLQNFKELNYRPNEMDLLGRYFFENKNKVNILNSLPYNLSKESNYVFDPASYGQFIGGTHQKPRRFYRLRYFSHHHIVGSEISSKRVKPKYNLGKPELKFKIGNLQGVSDIVNLHIHSKELNKYLPLNYRNII